MFRIIAASALVLAASFASAQDNLIPDRRIVVSRDVDFYGSDLQNIFDTTYDDCIQTCLANDSCVAFTFNQNANACFPKSAISEKAAYDGALSAEIYSSSAAMRTLAEVRAEELGFLRESDFQRANELAANIGRFHASGPWTVEEMLAAARDRRADGNDLSAMRWTGGALAKSDRSDLWSEYARVNSTLEGDRNSETQKYRERAFLGSINAYLRTDKDPQKINALLIMAEQLEQQSRGKAVLRSLRLADAIQPRTDVVRWLEDAIAKYGFRVSEHQVESDLEEPRFCAEFNEPLIKTGQDYTPFVKLPDHRLAVHVDDQRLCVEGLMHGQRIEVTFREGLPAKSGETLVKDTTLHAYVRDRSPQISFEGRAYVLPRGSDAGVPIETVNLDEVDLVLQRVNDRNILRAIQDSYFGKPLSYWQVDDFARDVAETVWSGTGEVQNTLNQTMVTRLPMADLVAGQPPGVYALTADLLGADKYDETSSTQWFLLSDIGLTSLRGVDGLHVFVRHLSDATPWEGAKVSLISRANRVLGEVESDAEGYARFDPGLIRGTGAKAPALLMVQATDDFTFLSLTDPAFDLSDRGVEGRPSAPPIDLFVATDRGAYRAGETVYATALARGDLVQALPALPVTAILTRPDGVEYSRSLPKDSAAGGHVFSFPIGTSAPRGRWTLDFKSDLEAPALASLKVLVEDFLPERIDFDLKAPEGPFDIDNPRPVTVEARYLFGAPGANLDVEGQVTFRTSDELPDFEGYKFGRYDVPFYGQSESFFGDVTDSAGIAEVVLPLPAQTAPGRVLEADITMRVKEGSGRPVERRLTHPIAARTPLIGIRPQSEDGVVQEGATAQFDVIALSKDLVPQDMDVTWAVNRVETRYQWYQLGGSWEWEPTTQRTAIASGTGRIGADPLQIEARVDWGQYEIVVTQNGGDYVSSAVSFDAGWYAPAGATETPDTLELSLDKKRYRSGDTAQLRLVPRYDGTALVSVVSNRLIAMQAVDVSEGENLLDLPVTDEWGAGAYVTVSVIRPADMPAGRNPSRALGLSYAKVDPGEKQLTVSIDAPDEAAPREALTTSVKVDGVRPGETAYVTLAAVDIGILNLTGFESPDPSEHYFGQRRLGIEVRDIYGRLIDGMSGSMGALRSGGDANASSGFDSPPPTEELLAYFQGPVQVDKNGLAQVIFDLPEFNGAVRLMAIAWSPTGVGQAEKDVLVRDPVVVTASLPRFLAPGDQSRLLLEFVHAQGPAGRMGLDIVADPELGLNAAAIPSGVTLPELGAEVISIPLSAGDVGDHTLRISLTTPDGKLLQKSLVLGVRANDPEISETRQLVLASGENLKISKDLFADLRPGSAEAILSSGALAKLDAPGLLRSLDRYPYGCTEQVASQALPLLYFTDIAEAVGVTAENSIQHRVDEAIALVLTRQSSNGAFGLWRPDSGDFWLDAYVSDFLSRAKSKGYVVPDTAFQQAMNNLRNRVNYAPDFDIGGEDLAYALMVLAREGAANMGDLRYYADVKADAFATPLAAAQLGFALASYGDQTRADAMFRQAARLIEGGRSHEEAPLWRADYGTRLRDTAGTLTLALEAGSKALESEALLSRISAPGRALSTQESVWSLMAAHALLDGGVSNTLSIDGEAVDGSLMLRLQDRDVGKEKVLKNEGDGPQAVTLTTVGVPTYPIQRGGYGYQITRQYFTLDGDEVSTGDVQSGQRFVTVLTINPSSEVGARLMVNDPLPAGFEIDNPNLLVSGDVKSLDWLKTAYVEHSEFRADRFLAAVDWRSRDAFRLAYVVRAVAPGDYHHPAASVEDMYRPQYRANTDATRLRVSE